MATDRRVPLTAEEIVATVRTLEDAEGALARFQDEIDQMTVAIEHHHQRAVDGLMDRIEYEDWRRRVDGALWHMRRGELKMQRFIEHERRNQQEHEAAEIRKALITRTKGPKTPEEIQTDIELKAAQARAARHNTQLREEQAIRDRRVVELVETMAQHDLGVLSSCYDLFARLLRITGDILSADEKLTVDALARIVKAWRSQEGI